MIENGWTGEFARMRVENEKLQKRYKRMIIDILLVFVGVPLYAVSLWLILEYWTN